MPLPLPLLLSLALALPLPLPLNLPLPRSLLFQGVFFWSMLTGAYSFLNGLSNSAIDELNSWPSSDMVCAHVARNVTDVWREKYIAKVEEDCRRKMA